MKKKLTLIVALVLVLGIAIGATIAYLTTSTAPVTNTFTAGDITIDLKESDYDPETNTIDGQLGVTENSDYKMVPGKVLPKDPTLIVKAESEPAYIYIKVVESNNTLTSDSSQKYLTYTIDSSWTALSGVDGVYYKQVGATTADTNYAILNPQSVTVNPNATNADMTAAKTTHPTIVFYGYAVQSEGMTDAADAWTKAAFTN